MKQNWVFGWGFSNPYVIYNDAHVGNFNMLLQVGIVGFVFFAYFWFCYFSMLYVSANTMHVRRIDKNALTILASVFAAMLVAHFSTYQFFGFTGSEGGIYFISIFVALSEFAARRARNFAK